MEVQTTLYVGDWFSYCGECGGNADPGEDKHVHGGPEKGSMTASTGSNLSDTNGCGARFTVRAYAPGARVYVDEYGNVVGP